MMQTKPKFLQLPNTRYVPVTLIDSLIKHVSFRWNQLDKHRPYTLEQICGEKYWSGLTDTKKRECGMIMKWLVDEDLVSYELISNPDAKPLWYRIL